MAFTQSTIVDGVNWGNKRLVVQRVTADGAEANLTTPLNIVDFVVCQPQKGQTMPAAHINANSSGTASNGTLGVSATSNGNIFWAVMLGT